MSRDGHISLDLDGLVHQAILTGYEIPNWAEVKEPGELDAERMRQVPFPEISGRIGSFNGSQQLETFWLYRVDVVLLGDEVGLGQAIGYNSGMGAWFRCAAVGVPDDCAHALHADGEERLLAAGFDPSAVSVTLDMTSAPEDRLPQAWRSFLQWDFARDVLHMVAGSLELLHALQLVLPWERQDQVKESFNRQFKDFVVASAGRM